MAAPKKQKVSNSGDDFDFAEAFTNRAAHRLGIDVHYGELRKAMIPAQIQGQWQKWRVSLLKYADERERDCYFRFPFTRNVYYTPTLQDVVDGMPAEMKKLHDANRLTVKKTDIGFPCQFQFNFDLTDLIDNKVEQMRATQQWPTTTDEDKKEICKRWLEADDDHELLCKKVHALKSAGWTMKHDPVRYVKDDRTSVDWPEGVEQVKYEHPKRMSERIELEMKKLESQAKAAQAGPETSASSVKIELG